jgi:1-pyrroline-5-carboxylate dehydrogenase
MKKTPIEVPLIIGGKEIRTGNLGTIQCPYDHKHSLGTYHKASAKEVKLAVDAALEARKKWAALPFEDR